MSFVEMMHAYFRGERLESLVFIAPLGLVSIAFAAALLLKERSGFTWGVAVPCLVLGLALVVTGGVVALRTPGQVAALTGLFQQDPGAFLQQELPRMRRVDANWSVYLWTWCAFVIGGLALRLLVQREWALGLGVALVFFGGVGLVIDGFAERRARPYLAALEQLQQQARVASP